MWRRGQKEGTERSDGDGGMMGSNQEKVFGILLAFVIALVIMYLLALMVRISITPLFPVGFVITL